MATVPDHSPKDGRAGNRPFRLTPERPIIAWILVLTFALFGLLVWWYR